MHSRYHSLLILLLFCLTLPSLEALLFPLLFPLSVKITIHSRPTHAPKSYHFEALPVYREVSIKGHASPHQYTYGSGIKYGTNYDDGHAKVYTSEPHVVVGSKYLSGHISGIPSVDGHISITANPAPRPKGSAHISISSGATYDEEPHYKGTPYDPTHYRVVGGQTHYKGSDDSAHDTGTEYEAPPTTHYKGTDYEAPPTTHYKGTDYEAPPTTHYKGTDYEAPPTTHYKGTDYEAPPKTHYKGTPYDGTPHIHIKGSVAVKPQGHYKGTPSKDGTSYDPPTKPKFVYKHNYIKSVGGYKLKDYINDEKLPNYDDDEEYIAIPPGKSFAEMEAAHKAANARKLGGAPKAYAAEAYADLGSTKYRKEYEEHDPSYLDDTLPAYKASVPKPRYGSRKVHDFTYEASSSRYDKVAPAPKEKRIYAGFGTSVYGDSYAKIVYVPKSLRVSIRRQ